MRGYLDAAYAMLADGADQAKLDRALDEPLPRELTEAERRRAEIARMADANRAAVAALSGTAGMARP